MTTQIYAASLSDYVAGRLLGKWINLSECSYDPDCVMDEIQEMLKQSKEMPAEEYAIHDYDDFPGNVASMLGEYPDLGRVCELAELIDEHGDMITALIECTGDLSYLDNAEEHFQGAFNEELDVKWYLFDCEFGDLDQNIQDRIVSYIDLDYLWNEYIGVGNFSCEYVNGTYYLFSF